MSKKLICIYTITIKLSINNASEFHLYQSLQLTFILIFRFVGYLEEEAVKTYSHIIEEIDAGRLPMWKNLPAPDIAVQYWQLPDNHTMRDVILAVRADEAHHRDVNHVLASMKLRDKNPFKAGE